MLFSGPTVAPLKDDDDDDVGLIDFPTKSIVMAANERVGAAREVNDEP